MRTSIQARRRGVRLADDLRISRRQAAPPPDVDSDSDSEDEGPDTPSPTETTFPSDAASTEQNSAVDVGNIGMEISDPTSTLTSAQAETALPATESVTQAQESNNGETTDQSGLISRGGVIAMGTLIGLATLVSVLFIIWKCRRRNRKSGSQSRIKPFLLRSNTMSSDPRVPPPVSEKHQSRMFDDLMTAAYAAENGNVYGGGSRPASQRSSGSLWREKQAAASAYYAQQRQQSPTRSPTRQQSPTRQKSTSGSLYANQLRTGFWKRGGDDPRVRVPPPAASVAGKTEMTSQSGATESTWNTWGVMQHKSPPKESFMERAKRLGKR